MNVTVNQDLTPRELELATVSQLLNRESLSEAQSEVFFAAVARGEIDPIVLASVLTALKLNGETAAEIAGAAKAFRAAATPLPATDLAVIDCCGTGGDGSNTINISTTAAIVAAAMGLKVAKHGNRSVSSQSGSADLLEQLGIAIQMSPQQAAQTLATAGVSFLFAPVYHSGIRQGGAYELKQLTWAQKHALLARETASDPARRAALTSRRPPWPRTRAPSTPSR